MGVLDADCKHTYCDVIGALSVRGDGHGDAGDAEEHEDEGPPCEVGEAAADGGYYAGDKGDEPGELGQSVSVQWQWQWQWQSQLTMPMEMVARAKGSPMMRPTLKDEARWAV